jgi:hypothetical protein
VAAAVLAVLLGSVRADLATVVPFRSPFRLAAAPAAVAEAAAPAAAVKAGAAERAPQSATTSQGLPPLVARVVMGFGATIRVAPSLDAPVLVSSRCGEVWPVVSVKDGWVGVKTPEGKGWVGGGRVMVSTAPATTDCADARFLPTDSTVTVRQASDCLPLRSRPSSEATSVNCVPNGHTYTVLDGPLEADPGEDWFRVSSPTTGTGWAAAASLYPS